MARTDQERWDQRYRDGDWVDSDGPSPIVEDAVPWLSPPGLALDVACGSGRNSLFLARYGFEAIAVDLSWRGLHLLAKRARSERLGVHPVQADLERFILPEDSFDVIVNTHFLMRDLFPKLQSALTPAGLLIIETYHVDEIDVLGGDIRREYALEPGELKEAFSDLDILLYEEGIFNRAEGERGLARLVARKLG